MLVADSHLCRTHLPIRIGRTGRLPLATLVMALALSGCSGVDAGTGPPQAEVTCDDALATVVHRERTGDTAGAINSELDWLGDNCPTEYGTFADYASAKATTAQLGQDTCASWTQYIRQEAIDLLAEDGLCSNGVAAPVADPQGVEALPGDGILWSDASDYAGTTQRVCGPLAGIGSSTDDVFLNIGLDYPDPGRFTIVLWDIGGVEPIAAGAMLCTSGPITLYEGVAQIELRSASSVEIYE